MCLIEAMFMSFRAVKIAHKRQWHCAELKRIFHMYAVAVKRHEMVLPVPRT